MSGITYHIPSVMAVVIHSRSIGSAFTRAYSSSFRYNASSTLVFDDGVSAVIDDMVCGGVLKNNNKIDRCMQNAGASGNEPVLFVQYMKKNPDFPDAPEQYDFRCLHHRTDRRLLPIHC